MNFPEECIVKTRQDAWTNEEDELLAKTVLDYIRQGRTQLQAFETVGLKLNRTANACGYRWNTEGRKHYQDAIEQAKKERKEKMNQARSTASAPSITLQDCILFLQSLKSSRMESEQRLKENDSLKQKNDELQNENERLQKKREKLAESNQTMEEEYAMMVKILQKASSLMKQDDDFTEDKMIH